MCRGRQFLDNAKVQKSKTGGEEIGQIRTGRGGGGGGGGDVTRNLVRAKSGPGGPLFAAKIGLTPDHFWLPKMVRVAKSGPGISACRKPFLAFRIDVCIGPISISIYAAAVIAYKRTYMYSYIYICMANMCEHVLLNSIH